MTKNDIKCPHLKSLCDRYAVWAVEEQIRLLNGDKAQTDEVTDAVGIEVAHNKGLGIEKRRDSIDKWLNNYGVLQGPNLKQNRQALAEAVLTFFDASPKPFNTGSIEEWNEQIINEYNRLNTELRKPVYKSVKVGQRMEKDLNKRSFLSLTSKALWCKYPDFTPIYDRNAILSLKFITRLRQSGVYTNSVDQNDNGSKLKRPRGINQKPITNNVMEYTIFVKNYLPLYFEIKLFLEQLAIDSDYFYPIRIFDKMLWILGSSSLDIANKKETYEAFKGVSYDD